MTLLGQFHNHYTRKEKLFFPIMERYGHDSPPKVMWGVDDDIRKLFRVAEAKLKALPEGALEEFSKAFEAFSEEFEAMIFKEEAILLMILLETFTQDDWLSIAEESDAYGYAIIKPTAIWKPKRERFDDTVLEEKSSPKADENIGNTITTMFQPMKWSLNEHLVKLDGMLNFVIRQKSLTRSRKSLTYSEVVSVTKYQCGSNLNV